MMQKSYPNEARPEPIITLGWTVLKNVKQFKYLGAQISDDASTSKEIKTGPSNHQLPFRSCIKESGKKGTSS